MRTHHDPRAGRLLSLLIACLLSLLGCEGTESTSPGDELRAPNEQLAALVALVGSYHELADMAVKRNDLGSAEKSMTSLIDALVQHDLKDEERTVFCMDAHSRLARLQWEQDRVDDALKSVEEGKGCPRFSKRPLIFEGYLYQLQGDLSESKGDDAGTVNAHMDAIKIFSAILNDSAPE